MTQCPASHLILAILISALLSSCAVTSGRLDPFPAKIGEVRPDGLVVGITRFADARNGRDQIAHLTQSQPPPRVLLEEAILVELQQNGVNGFLLSSPENPSQEILLKLARTLSLDAVLAAQVGRCEEKRVPRLFLGPEVQAFCSLEITLYDREGRVVYSRSGTGQHVAQMSFIPNVEAYHRPMFLAMEQLAENVIGTAFIVVLQRASARDSRRAP